MGVSHLSQSLEHFPVRGKDLAPGQSRIWNRAWLGNIALLATQSDVNKPLSRGRVGDSPSFRAPLL